MDIRQLAVKLDLDEDEFIQLMELFFETSLSDLNKMKTGLVQGDVEKVAEAAHSIKGASGNLGFHEIHEMAKGVEMKAKERRLEGLADVVASIKAKFDQISGILNAR
jgi:HPt (histidine-containing phosphotransfer) domain-containing protein